MISAEEAKALYDASGEEVEAFLKSAVEPKVVEAARAGKRKVFIFVGGEPTYGIENARQPVHDAAIVKLKKLNYGVSWGADGEAYVPRGLADDDGNGPAYINYGIHVGW